MSEELRPPLDLAGTTSPTVYMYVFVYKDMCVLSAREMFPLSTHRCCCDPREESQCAYVWAHLKLHSEPLCLDWSEHRIPVH